MFAGYTLDISPIEVCQDERLAAILKSLATRYPGEYRLGNITRGVAAPAIIGQDGRVVPIIARYGVLSYRHGVVTTVKVEDMATRADELLRAYPIPILLPATSFTLTAGSGDRIKNRVTRADGTPVMYLAALAEAAGTPKSAVIVTRRATPGTRTLSEAVPVTVDEEDVRAYLTDPAQTERILRVTPPAYSHTRI